MADRTKTQSSFCDQKINAVRNNETKAGLNNGVETKTNLILKHHGMLVPGASTHAIIYCQIIRIRSTSRTRRSLVRTRGVAPLDLLVSKRLMQPKRLHTGPEYDEAIWMSLIPLAVGIANCVSHYASSIAERKWHNGQYIWAGIRSAQPTQDNDIASETPRSTEQRSRPNSRMSQYFTYWNARNNAA